MWPILEFNVTLTSFLVDIRHNHVRVEEVGGSPQLCSKHFLFAEIVHYIVFAVL